MKYIKGFSLVEVMITLVILSFGLLSLIKFDIQLLSSSASAKRQVEAIHLAKDKLEEFRNVNSLANPGYRYEDIVSGEDVVEFNEEDLSSPSTTFLREWVVTENTSIGYKQVAILVSWEGRSNESLENTSITLNGVIGKTLPELSVALVTSVPEITPPQNDGTEDSSPEEEDSSDQDQGPDENENGDVPDETTDPNEGVEYANCQCQRVASSGNAKSQTATEGCTDACCKEKIPESTPKNGYFGAMCLL